MFANTTEDEYLAQCDTPKPDLTIWIDGGCRNNGRPNAEGYFSWLIRGKKDTRFHQDPAPELATNNRAEYGALLSVLCTLLAGAGTWRALVEIRSDSERVVNQMNATERCKEPTLVKYRDECVETIDALSQYGVRVSIVKAPRDEIVAHLGH